MSLAERIVKNNTVLQTGKVKKNQRIGKSNIFKMEKEGPEGEQVSYSFNQY